MSGPIPYNPNIPANTPDSEYVAMQTNYNSINTLLAIDHYPFNETNAGYHDVIRQPPFNNNSWNPVTATGAPTPIAGIQQLFSLNYSPDSTVPSTDTQLFSMTGSGTVSQLTGNFTQASNLSDGWCWIGGILVQWGTYLNNNFSTAPQYGTVTFKTRAAGCIPFPKYCFGVITSLVYTTTAPSSASAGSVSYNTSTLSNDKFDWAFGSGGSGAYKGFNWVAFGK